MARIAVPFHLNEHRDVLTLPVEPELVLHEPVPAEPTWRALLPLYEELAAVVERVNGDGPLTVFSGDCCASVGVLAGLRRGGLEPGVVWIDAHGDFNTPATTISGYVGGMVLAFITGRGDDDGVGARLGLTPVPDERVVLVDGRDLDPAEAELIASTEVRRVALDEVEAVLRVALPTGPLFLHIDLDVIDPSIFPGLLFPAAGGADLDAVLGAAAAVVNTGRLVTTSIGCTWHPDESDPAVCREVLAAVLGVVEGDGRPA
ncbi:MAG: arginase family protein [Acidimicrobiales bacterium]